MGWGDFQGRFDPLPLQPSFFLKRLVDRNEHAYVRFSAIASGFANGFAIGRELQSDEETNVIQLRPTHLTSEGNWTFEKTVYLDSENVPKSSSPALEAQIIFNNTNSQQLVGKTAVWHSWNDVEAFLSNHMTQITMDNGFDPIVYAFILNLYRRNQVFFNLCTNWNNQSGFAGDRLRRLLIPKLTTNEQGKLREIIDQSRENASRKQKESTDLLASIDDYLLDALGIDLPPEPESTIANRMFRTSASELGGWRFDPLYHAFKLWHSIETSGTPFGPLGQYIAMAKSGFAAGGKMQLRDDEGIIQIRPTNINSDRQLVFNRNIYLDRGILDEKPRDVLKPGEVLFNNTNSQEQVGKTVFFNLTDQQYVCSNHITRLQVNENKILPEYLTAVLNAYQRLKVFYSICTNWNNQSGVNVNLLRKIIIPVPDIDKQVVISNRIRDIQQQANDLRAQAKAELEAAKKQIEAILLGDTP